jgi:hypothetical protein
MRFIMIMFHHKYHKYQGQTNYSSCLAKKIDYGRFFIDGQHRAGQVRLSMTWRSTISLEP